MDLLKIAELRLQFLEEQAGRADQRIATLAQEALTHRGGGQHLGALNTLVEGHRERMAEAASAAEARRDERPQGQERDEAHLEATLMRGTVSGVNDGLTYLRAQIRAAEMSAQQAEAGMQEAQLNRRDLAQQAQKAAGEVGLMRSQLDRGVAREDLGKPEDPRRTREEVDRRKEAAQTRPPRGKGPRERREDG